MSLWQAILTFNSYWIYIAYICNLIFPSQSEYFRYRQWHSFYPKLPFLILTTLISLIQTVSLLPFIYCILIFQIQISTIIFLTIVRLAIQISAMVFIAANILFQDICSFISPSQNSIYGSFKSLKSLSGHFSHICCRYQCSILPS